MSAHWRLACGWITLFIVGTDLFVISPLLPAIAEEFRLSPAAAGLSVTVFSAIYLLSAPVIGQAADRLGRRRVLLCCLFGFAVANLLTGLVTGFTLLLIARFCAGAATAGVSPLIYAGVGDAAPPARRATWMGIAVSGLLLALSVGAPIGTILASHWGWRMPFFVMAALSLVLIGANRLVWPADTRGRAGAAIALPTLGVTAAAVRLAPTVLWATALYAAYTYLGVWLTGAGLSPTKVAWAIGFYGAGALAGTLLGGHMADRFGVEAAKIVSLAGLGGCLFVLAVGVGTGWGAVLVLLVLSVFAQLFFPAQQAGLARAFPERRALILALNNSALFLGISGGSLIGGEAMTFAGFGLDAGIGAGIAGVGLVVVVVTRHAGIGKSAPRGPGDPR